MRNFLQIAIFFLFYLFDLAISGNQILHLKEIITYSILFEVEIIVNDSLNDDSLFSTDGYSLQTTINCSSTNSGITETQQQFLGLITGDGFVTRVFTLLPPHYRASLRIDYILLDNWSEDLINIYIDDKLISQKLNRQSDNKKNFCNQVQNDLFFRGYFDFPHNSQTLTFKIELQSVSLNTDKFIAFRNIQVAVDTCHFSCLTCKSGSFNGCLSCPYGDPDGNDRCYCPIGKFAQNYDCVDSCDAGSIAKDDTHFCEQSCPINKINFQGGCLDIDPQVKNEQYFLAYGLFNNFSGIQISNLGWKLINQGQPGLLSTCGSYRIMGGYMIFATQSKMQISFNNLPKHYSATIKFVAVLIDWQTNSKVEVKLDGNLIETITTPSSGGIQICGLVSQSDYVISINNSAYSHSDAQMIITLTSNYVGDIYSFGFGIREFQVYLDKCPNHCQQCDTTGCILCDPGYYIYQKVCVNICPPKTYPLPAITKPRCDTCYSNCATCSIGNAQNECDSCLSNLYLREGSCEVECGDNYFANSQFICKLCDKTCLRCLDSLPNSCTQCQSPFYLDKKESKCVLGQYCPFDTYPDFESRTCQKCHSTCLTCNGPTETDCLTCSNYKDINSCKDICGVGKYANLIQKTCELCDPSCYTCETSATNCTSCANPNFLENYRCQPNCPKSKYGDIIERKCKTCPIKCISCVGGNESDCTACATGYFLQKLNQNLITGTCEVACNQGYWADSQFNECKQCYQNCKSCVPPGNQNSCLSCNINYYLTLEKSCNEDCPDKFYIDQLQNECKPCHNTCLKCSQAGEKFCTRCDTGRYLYLQTQTEGYCWINCPETKYNEYSTLRCQDCYSGCKTCSGKLINSCATCIQGKYLYKNQCMDSCPDGSYLNILSQNCDDCHLTCKTCLGPMETQCKSCDLNRYYDGKQCFSKCPNGTYANQATKTCEPCHATCVTCFGPGINECETCKLDRYLNINQHNCVFTCPDGQYAQKYPQQICKLCNAMCKSCTGPTENECTSCFENRFLLNKQCLPFCPERYFPEKTNNRCTACHHTCSHCDQSNQLNKCFSCYKGRYLYNQQCLEQCPNGYYGDDITKQCLKCNNMCQTCFGKEQNNCLSCYFGLFLQDYQCVSECSTYHATNQISNTCIQCPNECSLCEFNIQIKCKTCKIGYYLLENECLVRCPSGFYTDYDTQNCKECFKDCDECIGPSKEECTKWHVDYIPRISQQIFLIFIIKCIYCLVAFFLGFYLDYKQNKKYGSKRQFKEQRNFNKINPIIPSADHNEISMNNTLVKQDTQTAEVQNTDTINYIQTITNPIDIIYSKIKLNSEASEPLNDTIQSQSLSRKGKLISFSLDREQFSYQPTTLKNSNKVVHEEEIEQSQSSSSSSSSSDQQNEQQKDIDESLQFELLNFNITSNQEQDQTQRNSQIYDVTKDENTNQGNQNQSQNFNENKKQFQDIDEFQIQNSSSLRVITQSDQNLTQRSQRVGIDQIDKNNQEIPIKDQQNFTSNPQQEDRLNLISNMEIDQIDEQVKQEKLVMKQISDINREIDLSQKNQQTKGKRNKLVGTEEMIIESQEISESDSKYESQCSQTLDLNQSVLNRVGIASATLSKPNDVKQQKQQSSQIKSNQNPAQLTTIQDNNFLTGAFNYPLECKDSRQRKSKFQLYFITLLVILNYLIQFLYLTYQLFKQEFYELTNIFKHFDFIIERPLRALIVFSKLICIFVITKPYDFEMPFIFIILCMLGLKLIFSRIYKIMNWLENIFDELLVLFFLGSSTFIFLISWLIINPEFDSLNTELDQKWSLKYLMAFCFDLIFFQVGYISIQYIVTFNFGSRSEYPFLMYISKRLFFSQQISDFTKYF